MNEWQDEAVVLRMGHFRESDLWLRLLCRGRGALTLFAFGASRSRRRFCGCLDVFNTLQCRVRVSGRGDFLNLEEAALLRAPRSLRADWRRMGLAANCLRFLEALGVDGEAAPESFALLEDLREMLEAGRPVPALLALFFRLRLAGALGFAPNLGQCGLCGAEVEERASFVVDEGLLLCPRCRAERPLAETRYCVEVTRRGLDVLRAVQQTFPSAWPAEALPAPERRACARLIDGFVQYHLGLAWENGRFRRV